MNEHWATMGSDECDDEVPVGDDEANDAGKEEGEGAEEADNIRTDDDEAPHVCLHTF
jgi:hypothetical protein